MNMGDGNIDRISGDADISIAQQIAVLQCRTQKTGNDLCKIKLEEHAVIVNYQKCVRLKLQSEYFATRFDLKAEICRQEELQEQFISYKLTELTQLWLTLAGNLKDTVARLNTLQSGILDTELNRMKQNQRSAKNGTSFGNDFETIQEWCGSLAKLILQNKKQITEAMHLNEKLALNHSGVQNILLVLNSQIIQLLSSLVTRTFIIEEQPPQVIKIDTKFTSTVRSLVGGRLNIIGITPPQVKVSIINEFQVNELLKTNDIAMIGKAYSAEILNNTGTMKYHKATQQLSVTFGNMRLNKKIQRAERRGSLSVVDEKFSLLFQSQFSVGGGELIFNVWTLSLPVVVIVHGNQEPQAWATAIWDNTFAEPGKVPFTVPDKATAAFR